MSDLQFTKLSDVAAVTELDDGDYILTVVDGEVKKIAKSDAQFGGGIFLVTITEEDDGTLTADKTYEEILNAFNSHAPCFTIDNCSFIALSNYDEDNNIIAFFGAYPCFSDEADFDTTHNGGYMIKSDDSVAWIGD